MAISAVSLTDSLSRVRSAADQDAALKRITVSIPNYPGVSNAGDLQVHLTFFSCIDHFCCPFFAELSGCFVHQ